MKETPDDKVAAQIIGEIKKAKLLPAKRLAGLEQKLAAGSIGEADWILLADLSGKEEA
jgi:hypothetical protein